MGLLRRAVKAKPNPNPSSGGRISRRLTMRKEMRDTPQTKDPTSWQEELQSHIPSHKCWYQQALNLCFSLGSGSEARETRELK